MVYKIYRKLGLVKDTLRLPFGVSEKSIYLIFSNNVVQPSVSQFVIKDYALSQSPLSPEKILTPFLPQNVERTDKGIDVTTNSCKIDYQLISKPISITPFSTFELPFVVDLKQGGFCIGLESQDGSKFLA
ncbi:hypothetical protein, partial [Candidatus Paracaedibacter symbiosus]|uniref:hypothetical protein n=1 Tax=Candidatus Paracaedibacter symbiosus TaxID=244582 RepID=UPI000509F0AC